MKKLLALLVVTASLLCLLAACVEPDTGKEQGSLSEESTEAACLDAVPDDLNYGGEEVVILSRALQGWTQDEVSVPELNSEPVNDAIYNRNLTVEDRLGVKIKSIADTDPDQTLVVIEARDAVLAGSDEYDLVAAACYLMLYTTLESIWRDLTDLEYLDLSKDYWTQDYNDVISYGGKQHTATGSIALSTYRFAFVTMFNKKSFDDRSLPYLYETVNNGEWTLDYQATLAEEFYRDLNGDGKQDEDDFYGLLTASYISVDPYWASCDIPLVEKNADGEYEYVLDVGKLSDATDKILRLLYESGSYIFPSTPTDSEQDDIRIAFANGHGAMATTRLVAVEQADVRNMTDPYGIVPMPKYDTVQADYGTLMHDQFTVFCIPASASAAKLELIGATMEVMASESLRLVKPAYYEIALKRKYMSDPVAWDMLDLTFARVIVDAGVVYGEAMSYPHHKLRTIIQGKKNSVASQYGKAESKMNIQLQKLIKKLERLE